MNRDTPWGWSDSEEILIPGVMTFYGTPSHGGIYVEPEWNEQIPQDIRDAAVYGGGNDGWYEEDCEWVLPHLYFWKMLQKQNPKKATADRLEAYLWTCKTYYPQVYDTYFKEMRYESK